MLRHGIPFWLGRASRAHELVPTTLPCLSLTLSSSTYVLGHDAYLINVYLTLVHPQFFAVFDMDMIKASDPSRSVKIYALLPGMMSHILQVFGPERLGGKGNMRVKAQEEADRSGRPYEEVVEKVDRYCPCVVVPTCSPRGVDKIALGVSDEVVRIPGLPPMYDYENSAQDVSTIGCFGIMHTDLL